MGEVAVLRWPAEASSARGLLANGSAVLYEVSAEDEPPTITSCLEDWVRLPADERDREARIALLESRVASHVSAPRLDEYGNLHHRGTVLRLTPVQAALLQPLVECIGEPVSDVELTAAAASAIGPDALKLRTEMARLRARLRMIGLSVDRQRRRGYVLRLR